MIYFLYSDKSVKMSMDSNDLSEYNSDKLEYVLISVDDKNPTFIILNPISLITRITECEINRKLIFLTEFDDYGEMEICEFDIQEKVNIYTIENLYTHLHVINRFNAFNIFMNNADFWALEGCFYFSIYDIYLEMKKNKIFKKHYDINNYIPTKDDEIYTSSIIFGTLKKKIKPIFNLSYQEFSERYLIVDLQHQSWKIQDDIKVRIKDNEYMFLLLPIEQALFGLSKLQYDFLNSFTFIVTLIFYDKNEVTKGDLLKNSLYDWNLTIDQINDLCQLFSFLDFYISYMSKILKRFFMINSSGLEISLVLKCQDKIKNDEFSIHFKMSDIKNINIFNFIKILYNKTKD